MAEQRTCSERELRELIKMEVSTGKTMVVLNVAISGGELNNVVIQIAKDV